MQEMNELAVTGRGFQNFVDGRRKKERETFPDI